jgi:hypothetical protein
MVDLFPDEFTPDEHRGGDWQYTKTFLEAVQRAYPIPFWRNAAWRCMDGMLLMCQLGGETAIHPLGPCDRDWYGKDQSAWEPLPSMYEWCREYPDDDFIPHAATGPLIWAPGIWRCDGTLPVFEPELVPLDPEGYPLYLWDVLPEPSDRWVPMAIPEAVFLDRRAYEAYEEARAVMSNPSYDFEEKQERMRILQRNYGEEIVTTIARYVPVYDEEENAIVTFDTYMRRIAEEFSSPDPDAPINFDPVGAASRIFFDPSPETIAAMTGLGMPPEQVEEARREYEMEQQQIEESREQFWDNLMEGLSNLFGWGEE